jgi:LPS sulfotransferase NodH
MRTRADTPIDLPGPIAAYFAADGSDEARVARCFTENAVVVDERREHQGRRAIAQWKTEATKKYHYTSEPLEADISAADVTVIARVTGEFPGSPIELQYRFTLAGDHIARLEITA